MVDMSKYPPFEVGMLEQRKRELRQQITSIEGQLDVMRQELAELATLVARCKERDELLAKQE
jgi:hypothetical protein